MTEYLRKDASLTSEHSRVADPNSTERVTDRPVETDAESRTWEPAPAVEPRSTSVTSLAGTPGAPAAASAAAGTAVARAPQEERVALFGGNEVTELRSRWDSIQVGFVDEPRKAVQEADALVSETIKRLSDIFADERGKLEQQWDRNENISTEDFRVALRRYRSFFGRLLAI
jgi:hypothetical protein